MNKNFRIANARKSYLNRDRISREDVRAIVSDYFRFSFNDSLYEMVHDAVCDWMPTNLEDELEDLGYLHVTDLEDELSDYVTQRDLGYALDDYVSSGDLDEVVQDRLDDLGFSDLVEQVESLDDQVGALDENVSDLESRMEDAEYAVDEMGIRVADHDDVIDNIANVDDLWETVDAHEDQIHDLNTRVAMDEVMGLLESVKK